MKGKEDVTTEVIPAPVIIHIITVIIQKEKAVVILNLSRTPRQSHVRCFWLICVSRKKTRTRPIMLITSSSVDCYAKRKTQRLTR